MPPTATPVPTEVTAAMPNVGLAAEADVIPQAPKLYFIHVMKTAGTTLRPFIEQNYPHEACGDPGVMLKRESRKQGVARTALNIKALFNSKRFLRGHQNCAEAIDADWLRITVLREPAARVRSLYRFWQRTNPAEMRRGGESEGFSRLRLLTRTTQLSDFLTMDRHRLRRDYDNGMTKALVGAFPTPHFARLRGEALAKKATETLDTLACVGVMERFEDFLLLLCYTMRWVPPQEMQSLNVGRREESDDETMAIPEAIIAQDRVVYAHGLRVFQLQYDSMVRDLFALNSDVEIPREITSSMVRSRVDARAVAALREHARNTARPMAVRIDMAGPIRGTGWLEREGIDLGRIYRWTGPGMQSTLDILIANANQYVIELLVISVIHEDIVTNVRMTVNGVLAQHLEIGPHDEGRVVRGRVPGWAVERDGFVRIAIEVPRTASHLEVHPDCGDARQKGLAIRWVNLFAVDER